jgi:ADP-ribosylglycohydrolase
MITPAERYRGCLLGGAVGDALGAGVEFASLAEIRRRHGPAGVTGYVPVYGRLGAITDDTQMTLFTAEGLLRDQRRPPAGRDPVAAIWRAYRRWLTTQDERPAPAASAGGWLNSQQFLHARRAPGTTCLGALWAGQPGTLLQRLNDSKGCGGVMRVAPIGLADGDPFTLGCQAAALTHGHPSGYYAAGALAVMIRELVRGAGLRAAVAAALAALSRGQPDSAEVIARLKEALAASSAGPASPATIASLGGGWTGEEALAIAMHCALTTTGFRSGVLAAVNHGGDSDSTGAICGNLLGASLGHAAIDADLLGDLEGRDVITQVADDLHAVFALGQPPRAERYPAEREGADHG